MLTQRFLECVRGGPAAWGISKGTLFLSADVIPRFALVAAKGKPSPLLNFHCQLFRNGGRGNGRPSHSSHILNWENWV